MSSDTTGKIIDLEDLNIFCMENNCAWRNVGDNPSIIFSTYSREEQSKYSDNELIEKMNAVNPLIIKQINPSHILDNSSETDVEVSWLSGGFNSFVLRNKSRYAKLGTNYVWTGVSKKEEKDMVKKIFGRRWTTDRLLKYELELSNERKFGQCMDAVHHLSLEKLISTIRQYDPIATRPILIEGTFYPFETTWLKERLSEGKYSYAIVDIAYKKWTGA